MTATIPVGRLLVEVYFDAIGHFIDPDSVDIDCVLWRGRAMNFERHYNEIVQKCLDLAPQLREKERREEQENKRWLARQ